MILPLSFVGAGQGLAGHMLGIHSCVHAVTSQTAWWNAGHPIVMGKFKESACAQDPKHLVWTTNHSHVITIPLEQFSSLVFSSTWVLSLRGNVTWHLFCLVMISTPIYIWLVLASYFHFRWIVCSSEELSLTFLKLLWAILPLCFSSLFSLLQKMSRLLAVCLCAFWFSYSQPSTCEVGHCPLCSQLHSQRQEQCLVGKGRAHNTLGRWRNNLRILIWTTILSDSPSVARGTALMS